MRVYSYCELRRMLSEAGIVVVKACGDYRGSPFRINSPRLVVVAQKGQPRILGRLLVIVQDYNITYFTPGKKNIST